MNDFANATKCVAEEEKRVTVKEFLESMESILIEMEHEVDMISDAVYRGYRGEKHGEKEPANEPCATPPIVVVMRKQRDTAEHLLKEIMQIREALW